MQAIDKQIEITSMPPTITSGVNNNMKRFVSDTNDEKMYENAKKFRPAGLAPQSPPQFNVLPVNRFDRKFPSFRLPSEVGSFSLDPQRVFVPDRSQLRYFCPPDGYPHRVALAWDLRHGYRHFIRRDDSVKEKLDDLLRWILLNPQQFSVRRQDSRDRKKGDGKMGEKLDQNMQNE